MRQLHPGQAALTVNKAHDAGQHLDVTIVPQAQILRADAPLGHDRRRFREDQRGAAYRPAAQVHEMPFVREPVAA